MQGVLIVQGVLIAQGVLTVQDQGVTHGTDTQHYTYHSELFAMRLPESLSPAGLTRVTLSLERLVALGATKSKNLERGAKSMTVTYTHT